MRRLSAIVPQHVPYPEHQVRSSARPKQDLLSRHRVLSCSKSTALRTLQQLAEEAAFVSLGTSTAAAIVVCCIYFVFFCFSIFNYIYTKYPFYEILIVSNACKSHAIRTPVSIKLTQLSQRQPQDILRSSDFGCQLE